MLVYARGLEVQCEVSVCINARLISQERKRLVWRLGETKCDVNLGWRLAVLTS